MYTSSLQVTMTTLPKTEHIKQAHGFKLCLKV